jgi:hypothetical protein
LKKVFGLHKAKYMPPPTRAKTQQKPKDGVIVPQHSKRAIGRNWTFWDRIQPPMENPDDHEGIEFVERSSEPFVHSCTELCLNGGKIRCIGPKFSFLSTSFATGNHLAHPFTSWDV